MLAGVFPIAINFWAALGLTVYFLASTLLQYYVKAPRHFQVREAALGDSLLGTCLVMQEWPAIAAQGHAHMIGMGSEPGDIFRALSNKGRK